MKNSFSSTFTLIITLIFPVSLICQQPEVVITTGHNDMITSTAFSPNGKFFASAGNNKIIKIWDVLSGREFRSLTGNDGRINFMKFIGNGDYIGAIENHGNLKIWNAKTGELLHQIPSSYAMTDFSEKDNMSKVIHANPNNFLELYDLEKKEIIATNEEIYCSSITYNENKDVVYVFDHLGNILTMSANDLSVQEKVKVFDSPKFAYTRPVLSEDGQYLAVAFGDNTVHVFDTKNNMETVYKSNVLPEKIVEIEMNRNEPVLYYATHTGKVQFFDFKKKKMLKELDKEGEMFGVNQISRHPNEPILAMSFFSKVKFYNLKTEKYYLTLEALSNKMINMAYDPTGQYIAGASDKVNIQLWDLEKNKVGDKVPLFFPCQFSADGRFLYGSSYGVNIGIYDIDNKDLEGVMSTGGELLKKMQLSNNGKYLAASTYTGKIHIYDLEQKKKINTVDKITGILTGLAFSPDDKLIAACNMNGDVLIMDWKKNTVVHTPQKHATAVGDVAFSNNGKYFASGGWDHYIFLYSTSDYTKCDTLKGHTNVINTIDFNDASTLLASGATNNVISKSDNSIKTWSVKDKTEICTYTGHWDGVNEIKFENGSDRIYSCANDGTLQLSDPTSCKGIATFISVGIEDYAILTPDHYYTASKDALNAVSFRLNDELYPFEQFDLKLNRPDIIAERIGKTPERLIKAFYYIYKKRLRRMGFKEEDLGNDFHVPQIRIKDKNDLPVIVNDNSITFKVIASDDQYNLDRLNVYINDVPYFGTSGITIDDPVKSIEKQITLNLIPGENEIQVAVLNEKGAESLKSSYNLIYETEKKSGDLYVISIGVSDYQDDRFDLKYPSKDAQDLINTIEKSKQLYNEIHLKKLIDSEVTVENFKALREYLKDVQVNDVVLVFMAGHGVLNSEYDYFFGTHDMNFEKPEENGLAYEVIDALINDIKALKKLLIMDTCHSGEVDKEEVEEVTDPEVIEGDVDFRAAGVGIRETQAFGLENSQEFMETMFSDIRKGSGATVISSAGGAEYAMESDQWSNGLFTYCLLSGIDARSADINHDGQIKISEIKQFVYEKVKQLSHGKQKPTARQTNIKMDYRIF